MIFLVAVLLTAVFAGLWPSIAASVLAVLVYDFFFVEPLYTFTIARTQHAVEIVVFLLVAILTSQLTARAREQADAARRRESRTAALYAFAREVAGGSGRRHAAARDRRATWPRPSARRSCCCCPRASSCARARRIRRARRSPPPSAPPRSWAFEHGEPAGHGTDTLPGSEWLHVPLATVRGCVGVLALHGDRPDAFLPLEQRQLLEALAGPGRGRDRAHAHRRRARREGQDRGGDREHRRRPRRARSGRRGRRT